MKKETNRRLDEAEKFGFTKKDIVLLNVIEKGINRRFSRLDEAVKFGFTKEDTDLLTEVLLHCDDAEEQRIEEVVCNLINKYYNNRKCVIYIILLMCDVLGMQKLEFLSYSLIPKIIENTPKSFNLRYLLNSIEVANKISEDVDVIVNYVGDLTLTPYNF